MGATATRMTSAQYYAATLEDDRTQLVEGEIVVCEPKPIHALLQMRLAAALHSWVEGEGSGLALLTTGVEMDRYNVYGPDLIWFSEPHRPTDLDEYPERVPDLCVEIRSPGTWRYDIGAKMRVYESGGLPELWLVDDIAETVLVYRRSTPRSPSLDVALELSAGDTLASPQLPGFALPLDELFKR